MGYSQPKIRSLASSHIEQSNIIIRLKPHEQEQNLERITIKKREWKEQTWIETSLESSIQFYTLEFDIEISKSS